MQSKLEQEIREIYPELYEDCTSFTCGDGWHPILLQLTKDIKELGVDDVRVVQVKEKFGGLRYYTYSVDKRVEGLIRVAENKSLHTCEWCGSKEVETQASVAGWIRTLCHECSVKAHSGWRPWLKA